MAKKTTLNLKEFDKELYLLISNTYLKALEEKSPVNTGELKRSWYLISKGNWEYELTNDVEYAKYLDAGTGIYATKGYENNYSPVNNPKPITPKTKKALSYSVGGTKFVFASVKGIQPMKFVQEVMLSENVKRNFEKGVEKLMTKYFIT